MIHVQEVTVKQQKKTILHHVTATFETGKIYTILGPNGSGKSTLIKAITNNIPITDGKILLNNRHVNSIKTKELARRCAVLWQKNTAPADLTVRRLVEYGRYPHQRWNTSQEDQQIVKDVLKMVDLSAFAEKKISQLSGGEAQRAWLGMALAQQPEILFLDEPTTYLDVSFQLELLSLIKRLNMKKEQTIIMVLHDLNQASMYSDYLYVLKEGKVAAKGTPQEVMNQNMLKHIFNVHGIEAIDENTNKPIFKSFHKIESGRISE